MAKAEKKIVVCPACGQPVKAHEEFCLKCGEKLTEWPEDPNARLKSSLSPKQLGFSFAFFCLAGVVSSIFNMIPRWIIGLITRFGTGGGIAKAGAGYLIQNLLTGLLGAAVCFIACSILFRKVGEDDMVFVRDMGYKDRAISIRNVALLLGIVAVVYYLLMMVIDQPFLTGPTMYLTFLISNADPTLRYPDVSRATPIFPKIALLIHVLIMIPGAFLGYRKGYNDILEKFEEDEKTQRKIAANKANPE